MLYTFYRPQNHCNLIKAVFVKADVIATTWRDGPYLLVVKITSSKPESDWNLTGEQDSCWSVGLCWVCVRLLCGGCVKKKNIRSKSAPMPVL